MEIFAKIVDCIQPLTIFGKQIYQYASDKTKQNPGALSSISQNIKISTHFHKFLSLLKLILSSHYYLAVRFYQSQIQYTCLWFQVDLPMLVNIYMILISHYLLHQTITDQLLVIVFVKVKKFKVNYTVLL